jgi:hypothetical protein
MNPDNRRRRTVVIVVAVLGAALLALAIVSEAVFHTSIDPTESAFAVTLHNDTSSAVVVKQCDAKCNSFHERDRLAPGESVPVNTSSDNVANWWAVTDNSGKTLGCLPLRYSQKVENLVVNVSEAGRCPATTSGASSNVVGALLGFGLFLGVAAIGVASTVFATQAAYRALQHRGVTTGLVTFATVVVAIVVFLGGWLVFDLYVVAHEVARRIRRPAPAT